MCGIAGIIKRDKKVNFHDIKLMTNALVHRGPDDEGIYCFQNWGIGHRRLSIIDLASGHQPMKSIDGNIHVVFNGEIYNYKELRKELQNKGYRFSTNSDTEVIIYAYMEWKEKCLSKLRGMFAIGLVDCIEKKIIIARDYLGIKPIVFFHNEEMFAFASELQALKEVEGFEPSINLQAVNEYLWLQYIPAPKTIYNNTYKLLPGHYLSIGFDFNISDQICYYDFSFRPENNFEKNWLICELDSVLKESVEKHLISDVEYGAFLSGGIDSSMIVNYMSKILKEPVKTFSIGFSHDEYSEAEYAKYVSKKTHSDHYFKIIDDNALKILPQLVKHYGEPYGDSSAIPTYYVSELASNYVKMVLTGDGADELFVGYPRYNAYKKCMERTGKSCVFRHIKETFRGNKIGQLRVQREGLNKWLSNVCYMELDVRNSLWKQEYQHLVNSPLEIFENVYDESKTMGDINRAQYIDIKTYLPNDILTKVDIASMMHSIETRTPFIDIKVLELALRIPEKCNWMENEKYGFQGKVLLKEILKKDFSEDFLLRKKRGFSMPLNRWLEDENNYAYQLKKALTSSNAKINNFFCKEGIEKVVNGTHAGSIWLLIFLEEWLQQNT